MTAPVGDDLTWLDDLERAHERRRAGGIPRPTAMLDLTADAPTLIAELRKRDAALRAVLDKHRPVEWQECGEDGVPDLDKPLPTFCAECTDDDWTDAVEFGDTIDAAADVVTYPCATVQVLTAALTPESVTT